MTAAVCSGVTAAGVKWRVVGDPNCPSVHAAAATSSATKDCRWVPEGHPIIRKAKSLAGFRGRLVRWIAGDVLE